MAGNKKKLYKVAFTGASTGALTGATPGAYNLEHITRNTRSNTWSNTRSNTWSVFIADLSYYIRFKAWSVYWWPLSKKKALN
tara:strand:+ start:347 stop:592 length:246 start_codon:yes stop_codon:yes gene_type:complete